MGKSDLKFWWDDTAQVRRLIDYLVDHKMITTVGQAMQVLDEPQAWNRSYELMMMDLAARIDVSRPRNLEWFDDRFYPINGDWLESITTILSCYPAPELVKMIGLYGGAEMEVRKKIKGERGSKVHDTLQKNLPIVRSNFDDDEWLLLMRAKMFNDRFKPKMLLNEQWCWSTTKHYAGRFDRIVLIDNKVTLIDWKTGYVGRESWLQLAAEKFAIEESMPFKIERWGIVHLDAKGADGWRFLNIETRSDVAERIAGLGGGADAVENAIQARYVDDIRVFDNVHEVWKDLFAGLKPKRFPFDPPDIMDISIPIIEDNKPYIEVEVQQPAAPPVETGQVSGPETAENAPGASEQMPLALEHHPAAQTAPVGYYGEILERIGKLSNTAEATTLWDEVAANTGKLSYDEMSVLVKKFNEKKATLGLPASDVTHNQEKGNGKVSKRGTRGKRGKRD